MEKKEFKFLIQVVFAFIPIILIGFLSYKLGVAEKESEYWNEEYHNLRSKFLDYQKRIRLDGDSVDEVIGEAYFPNPNWSGADYGCYKYQCINQATEWIKFTDWESGPDNYIKIKIETERAYWVNENRVFFYYEVDIYEPKRREIEGVIGEGWIDGTCKKEGDCEPGYNENKGAQ